MSKVEALVDEYMRAVDAARSLHDTVKGQADGATAEQRAQMADITTKCAELHTQVDELRALDAAVSQGDKAAEMWKRAAGLTGKDADGGVASLEVPPVDMRSLGLAAAEGRGSTFKANIGRARREREIMRAGVGADDIAEVHKRGMTLAVLPDGRIEARALNTGATSTGDHLIPTLFERNLYDFMEYLGGVRRCGPTIMTTATGAQIEYPIVKTHDAVTTNTQAAPTAEEAQVGETLDTFDQIDLFAYVFTGAAILSKELLRDNEVGLERHIARMIARQITHKTEQMYNQGSGSSQPKGVFNSPPADRTFTTSGSNAIDHDDITRTLFKLDPGYLAMGAGCKWTMGPQTYAYILTLEDGDGRPLFHPSLLSAETNRMMGRPVIYNAHVTDTTTAAPADNAVPLMIACWEDFYIIRDVSTIEIDVSTHVLFRNRQVVFQGEMRTDGRVLDERAASYLKIKA